MLPVRTLYFLSSYKILKFTICCTLNPSKHYYARWLYTFVNNQCLILSDPGQTRLFSHVTYLHRKVADLRGDNGAIALSLSRVMHINSFYIYLLYIHMSAVLYYNLYFYTYIKT